MHRWGRGQSGAGRGCQWRDMGAASGTTHTRPSGGVSTMARRRDAFLPLAATTARTCQQAVEGAGSMATAPKQQWSNGKEGRRVGGAGLWECR